MRFTGDCEAAQADRDKPHWSQGPRLRVSMLKVRVPTGAYRRCREVARRTLATATEENPAGASAGQKRARAQLVNGRAMATEILDEVRREVDLMRSKHNTVPGLAVIMVGERRDSAKYVSMKQAVAESIGFESFSSVLPATATHEEVLECIRRHNKDPRCHGILLQLPVPAHLDPRGLLGAIKVEKDVECFNPTNAGRMTAWRRTVIAPCTPLGVMEMLFRLGVEVRGKHAVVLGESSVVGLPMCLLLNEARATVSMVHKETPHPEEFTRRADIVVAATGVPELVRAGWVKPGAVVIDVGINFVRDDERQEGFRVVGDVHPDVREVASIVSPVPGGVGPMTIAMLMRNCANMAFLQSRWDSIAGALHPGLAAENARRMHAAIVDLAWRGSEELSGGGGGGREGREDRREGGAGEVEAREQALERAGDSISDAELLTIINDSEKNAFGLLSFLELGSSHDRLLEAAGPSAEEGAEAGVGLSGKDEGDSLRIARSSGGVGTSQSHAEGGDGDGLCSGEEGPMEALDEWHLEAERAAKEKGEVVSPHSKGQALLLEDELEGLREGSQWWKRSSATTPPTAAAGAGAAAPAAARSVRPKDQRKDK
ncbi:unnamed protein product [Scytosiphon promiscuus]